MVTLEDIRKLELLQLHMCNNIHDPLLRVKLYYPDFSWSWYPVEFDGDDIFFGLVDSDFPEMGYFSLSELQTNRGKLGLEIELDRYFIPTRLSDLRPEV